MSVSRHVFTLRVVGLLLLFVFILASAKLISPQSLADFIKPVHIALQGGCDAIDVTHIERSIFKPSSPFKRSHCNSLEGVNELESESFVARYDGLQFYYYGTRTLPTLVLSGPDGDQHPFTPVVVENSTSFYNLAIPDALQGKTVKLKLSPPHNASADHWIALTQVQNAPFTSYVAAGYLSLLTTLLAVGLVFLGFYAFIRHYFDQAESLLLLPLLTAVLGYIAFWAYFIHFAVGAAVSCISFILVGCGAWWTFKDPRNDLTLRLTWDHAVLLLILAFSLFVLSIAYFPYTFGLAEDFQQVAHRWREMPVDSYLPKIFAERIWAGSAIHPFIPGWLSSDRPPLQTGINLMVFPILHSGLSYQVLSTLLQASMIAPLVLILQRLGLGRTLFWAILSLLSCGFVVLNTAYVWPKFIAVTYLLTCYLVVFDDGRLSFSPTQKIILIAVSGSSAMLCHGGSVFALLPIFLIALGRGISYCYRVLIPSGVLMVVCYTPWIFYQRVIDPPGDRLLKWHFAGHPSITDKSFGEIIVSAYSALTLHEWLANQWANIERVFDRAWQIVYWIPEIFKIPFHAPHHHFLQDITFGNFFFSMWFLSPLFALIAYALSRTLNTREIPATNDDLRWLTQISILGLCIWIVLMFRPGSTSNHLGTYFIWISWFLVAVSLAARTHVLYLACAAVLNTLLFAQFYVLDYVWFERPAQELYMYYSGFAFSVLLISLYWLQWASNQAIARDKQLTEAAPG